MAQVVLSRHAIDDLERLAEFLLVASPESAASALEAIIEAFGILAHHPLIGRRVAGEVRELIVSRGASGYVALYRFEPSGDTVRVLRIRHQREAGYVD